MFRLPQAKHRSFGGAIGALDGTVIDRAPRSRCCSSSECRLLALGTSVVTGVCAGDEHGVEIVARYHFGFLALNSGQHFDSGLREKSSCT